AKARTHEMARLGVKNLYELPFNTEMAALSPRDFAKLILQEGLGVSHVVVGADFCFGAGRSGRAKDLVSLGKEFGFGVTVSQLLHTSGAEISSTAIRQALKEGDPQLAQQMLGHPHRIEGPVIHGEKRGRDLG
ncbi:MAG TPA: bifunctional riboflavin kinase/FMN adenylyltransferase, partial [Rhodobacter sp.]|nr:bifunctional riboflavin kinase/FMN adenylyltransferase [Rhodobacter sp.]